MGIKHSLEVLERVNEVATLAGLKGKIEDDKLRFTMGFDLGEGRGQMVYVRDASKDLDHRIVTIFSPALIVKKGLFSGFSKDRALDLLRMNEQVLFARFGIWESPKETMVVASCDHLLSTLDPDELAASAFHVAFAADTYEKKNGQDMF
jgi:hypothetical protein